MGQPGGLGAAVGAAAAALALGAAEAAAYDAPFTHRWITREAAARLVAEDPDRYGELLLYVDEVAAGSELEDHLLLDGDGDPRTLRVMRHFFRPTDGAGLEWGGRRFPSSYEWGVVPNDENRWGWQAGLDAWRRGDRAEAYRTLGHLVHLIQDLTVPAHAHLDDHGPPHGDDYESWCTSRMIDEHTSLLPVPPPGAPVPRFEDPWDAWIRTAWASYRRNLYPGDLSDEAAARGAIAGMFPDLRFHWFHRDWRIVDPPVGALGKGFLEAEPGAFYFKRTAFPARIDRAPGGGEALEPNAGDAPMAELLARDLVPVAILHSAGLMRLFLDEAHALPPAQPPAAEDEPPAAVPGCGVAAGGGAGAPWLLLLLLLLLPLARRRTP